MHKCAGRRLHSRQAAASRLVSACTLKLPTCFTTLNRSQPLAFGFRLVSPPQIGLSLKLSASDLFHHPFHCCTADGHQAGTCPALKQTEALSGNRTRLDSCKDYFCKDVMPESFSGIPDRQSWRIIAIRDTRCELTSCSVAL